MKKNNSQRGIGLVAAIVIVAVVGVGGYAVYNNQVKKKSSVDISTDAKVSIEAENAESAIIDLSAEVEDILNNVHMQLRLGTETALNASTELLHNLENSIDLTMNQQVSMETRMELDRFKKRVMSTREKISSSSSMESDIMIDSDVLIENIEVSFEDVIETSTEVNEEEEVASEDAGMLGGIESESSLSIDAMLDQQETDDEASISTSSESDIETSTDESNTSINVESDISLGLGSEENQE